MKLFWILLFPVVFVPNLESAELTVEIAVKNNNGHVLIALYQGEEGFPSNSKQAIKRAKLPIENQKAVWKVAGLKEGEYAFSFIHDENDNGKMDFNFLGIPNEGYGFSNNAKGMFGPPKYKEAKFQLSSGINNVKVKPNY